MGYALAADRCLNYQENLTSSEYARSVTGRTRKPKCQKSEGRRAGFEACPLRPLIPSYFYLKSSRDCFSPTVQGELKKEEELCHVSGEEAVSRVRRNALACPWGLRQCCSGGGFPQPRNRVRGRRAGLRVDGSDDGLRGRAHFGLPPEPGGDVRTVGRQTFPRVAPLAVHRRAARGRDCRRRNLVRHRQRQPKVHPGGRVRLQRLRRTLAGRLFTRGLCSAKP